MLINIIKAGSNPPDINRFQNHTIKCISIFLEFKALKEFRCLQKSKVHLSFNLNFYNFIV